MGADLGAFQEGEAAGFAGDKSDGALDFGQRLASEVFYQTPDHQRLAHLRATLEPQLFFDGLKRDQALLLILLSAVLE